MGRILGGAVLLLAWLAATWPATSPAAGPPAGFTESVVASGLSQPTAIAFLPDGTLLVTEKGGALKLVCDGAASTLTTFPVCADKSMGVLGVAVDPAFATTGQIYVYRTSSGPGGGCTEPERYNRVGRLTLAAGAVAAGPVDLPFAIRTDNGQHNGGTLRVGLDGKLYVSTGDTGVGDFKPPGGGKTLPGESINPFAQDLGELPGKVLRVNLDGSIPPDNPFVHQAGAHGEIFAYGFRNPFRFGIDPATGRLWLGDVGQSTWEELDVIQAGANYGWPGCEGTDPTGCTPPGQMPPVLKYATGGPLGASITGGAFAPCGFGSVADQYFFGDVITERLYRVAPNAARDGVAGPLENFADAPGGPVDIVFGPARSLYYVAFNSGQVRRIAPPPGTCAASDPAPTEGAAKSPSASADRTAPRASIRSRARQRVGRLSIQLRLDEPAIVTVSAAASVPAAAGARTYRWKRVQRRLLAGRTRIRLALSPRALPALRRFARRRPLRARVKLTAADAAGNHSRVVKTVRLVAGK